MERYVRTSTTPMRADLGYLASASVPTGFCEWNPCKSILRDIHLISHYLLGVCIFRSEGLIRTVVFLLMQERGDVRYNYKHSILFTDSIPASRGQRLSIMVRVRLQLALILQDVINRPLQFLKDCPPLIALGVEPSSARCNAVHIVHEKSEKVSF